MLSTIFFNNLKSKIKDLRVPFPMLVRAFLDLLPPSATVPRAVRDVHDMHCLINCAHEPCVHQRALHVPPVAMERVL